jgi:secreted trypsin-like serine protease
VSARIRIRVRWLALYAAVFAALFGAVAKAGASSLAHKSVIPGPFARTANLAEWQFTVAVRSPRGLCTGVVVGPTKVLTAAHCLSAPRAMSVLANQVSLWSAGGETLGVQGVATAPDWTDRGLGLARRGFENDLAVLTLSAATTAPPIRLATPDEDAAYTGINSRLEVAGYGVRNPFKWGKPKFGVLTASSAFVTGNGCSRVYVPATMICDAGPRSKWVVSSGRKRRSVQSVPCSGDSGGPMVARTAAGPVLVGIMEAAASPRKSGRFYGVLCGLRGYNSIHTRVAVYLSFVQENL